MKIIEILDKLAKTQSTNEKIEILKENKDNPLFQKVLYLATSPKVKFYMKELPERCPSDNRITLNEALFSLELTMKGRKSVTKKEKLVVSMLLGTLDEGDCTVLSRVLLKDLRCGVSVGLLSKAFNIPEDKTDNDTADFSKLKYPVMTCSPKKDIKHIKYPAYCQIKMDGARFNAQIRNGEVALYTRAGNRFHIDHIEKEILSLGVDNAVLDGELLILADSGGFELRKVGNGILTKIMEGSASQEELGKVVTVLWDFIELDDFNNKKSSLKYQDRFNRLNDILKDRTYSSLQLIESVIVESEPQAMEVFEKVINKGIEGVILKNLDSIWESKRSKNQVKLKKENTCDLEIEEVIEGTGKNKGKLGSLLCASRDRKIEVNVGTGFTEGERVRFYETKESLIGRIVEVKYNEKIEHAEDKERVSLFLPVFVKLRTDKTIADSEKEVV
jgi:ATP-dependent DNA ligase